MTDDDDIHDGGFSRLVEWQTRRQRPFPDVDDLYVAPNADLSVLFEDRLSILPYKREFTFRGSVHRKSQQLEIEFEGAPKILHLHAVLIAILRRKSPPEWAVALFHRIWEEHGDQMASLLNIRWMISTATTFADIGQTSDLRAGGMALSIMFDMIKLHDSERRLSGRPGRTPFTVSPAKKRFPVAFNMPAYSFKAGDLDKIMLARIWQLCEHDETLRPLGHEMLKIVMRDQRSIFARVQELKRRSLERDSNT